jgi:hypothetical protein
MPHSCAAFARALALSALALTAAVGPSGAQQPDTSRDSTHRAARDSSHANHTLPVIRVVAAPTQRADAASSVIILPGAIHTVPATDAWDIVRQRLARQQPGGARPRHGEQTVGPAGHEDVHPRGERLRRQLAFAGVHLGFTVLGRRPQDGGESQRRPQ